MKDASGDTVTPSVAAPATADCERNDHRGVQAESRGNPTRQSRREHDNQRRYQEGQAGPECVVPKHVLQGRLRRSQKAHQTSP